jgi:hypothetical protein
LKLTPRGASGSSCIRRRPPWRNERRQPRLVVTVIGAIGIDIL